MLESLRAISDERHPRDDVRDSDADELSTLRQALAERTRQLEASEARFMDAAESMQRQAEVHAIYSHDMRNPLAAIIGYADLLEMGVPERIPSRALESVRRIRDAAMHLQLLLDQAMIVEAG